MTNKNKIKSKNILYSQLFIINKCGAYYSKWFLYNFSSSK